MKAFLAATAALSLLSAGAQAQKTVTIKESSIEGPGVAGKDAGAGIFVMHTAYGRVHSADMEQALKGRGLPVQVVTYPGAYHNFERGSEAGPDSTNNGTIVAYSSSAAADAQKRTIDWFSQYLK